jgi:hypothetical protein
LLLICTSLIAIFSGFEVSSKLVAIHYTDLAGLQADLDTWVAYYNNERTHQGKMCCGQTPIVTWNDGKQIWKEKLVA